MAGAKTSLLFFALVFLVLSSSDPCESREPRKPFSTNPEAQKHVDMAWEALDREMNLKELDEAIGHLKQAAGLDPANDEILVELADEYFQRGDQMPKKSEADFQARNVYFRAGYEAATRALGLRESPGSHYWIATNLAAMTENRGSLKQASIFPTLKRHMEWIEAHDRHYRYGAVARFWSGVVTRIPGVVVKIVGQDPTRVFAALEEAIEAEPRFISNYVYKAEFYLHMGKKDEALASLQKALEISPEAFPEERAYNRFSQRKARMLLKEWTGHDPSRFQN